jgi:hypothetical protein
MTLSNQPGFAALALFASMSLLAGCGGAGGPTAPKTPDFASARSSAMASRADAPELAAGADALEKSLAEAERNGDGFTADMIRERLLARYTRMGLVARNKQAERRLTESKQRMSQEESQLAPLEALSKSTSARVAELEAGTATPGNFGAPYATEPSAGRNQARLIHSRRLLHEATLLCDAANTLRTQAAKATVPAAQAATKGSGAGGSPSEKVDEEPAEKVDDAALNALSTRLAKVEPSSSKEISEAIAALVDETTATRALCLRRLTLARRAAGPLEEGDQLLEQLSDAKLGGDLLRDERGVILRTTDTRLLAKRGELQAISKAHPKAKAQVLCFGEPKPEVRQAVTAIFGNDVMIRVLPGGSNESGVEIAFLTK